MLSPKEEAELIINALFEDFGTGGYTRGECPFIDGRGAILEMKNNNFPGWQELEWAGYHTKYLIQKECELKISDKVQPYDLDKKRHFVKGNFVWDARFNAEDSNYVPLGDVTEYDDIIKRNNGIGILAVESAVSCDRDGDFRRWHEEQKGGSSVYTLTREMEGRPVRLRKTAYMITKVLAYFFPADIWKNGIDEGWISDKFQRTMRNADGSPRNPKYRLNLARTPEEYLLFVKNFNEDPEEFAEEFPDYS